MPLNDRGISDYENRNQSIANIQKLVAEAISSSYNIFWWPILLSHKKPPTKHKSYGSQLIQKCVLLAKHILLTEVIYINLLNGCSPRGNEIFSTICKTILNISISSCFLCFGSKVNSGISDFYLQNQLNFGYVAFRIFLDTSFSLIHIR